MLYLEDYVEMIEHLPQELRDRFTEMREMDLGVQNSMDSIEKKIKIFFSNAKKMKPNDKEAEHEAIKKEYYKTLEDADEKVHLANQMYDLVDRYLRRLDQELNKFKGELEADHKGITEILEKRSLELDQPPTINCSSSQKENRYSFSSTSRSRDNHSYPSRSEKRRDSSVSIMSQDHPHKRIALEKLAVAPSSSSASSLSIADNRPASANSAPLISQPTSIPATASTPTSAMTNSVGSVSTTGGVSYNLGHISAGGNAIAAAASQAIAATQHMQQGRRTASLKASYEAINTGGVHAAEFSRELAGAAQTAIAAIQESSKKNKKKSSSIVTNSNVISPAVQTQAHTQQIHQTHHQQHTNHPSQHHTQQYTQLSHHQQPHHQQHHQQQHTLQQQGLTSNASVTNLVNQTNANQTAQTNAALATQVVADVENSDWTLDPNEPRYCICNQVSYGDMVACDNTDCPFEWFHYPCVNITAPPKGKWYCPQCITTIKRRGSRKN